MIKALLFECDCVLRELGRKSYEKIRYGISLEVEGEGLRVLYRSEV